MKHLRFIEALIVALLLAILFCVLPVRAHADEQPAGCFFLAGHAGRADAPECVTAAKFAMDYLAHNGLSCSFVVYIAYDEGREVVRCRGFESQYSTIDYRENAEHTGLYPTR